VGRLQKNETRELARHYNLLTAEKYESQDICFIPTGDRIAFLKREGASAGFVPGDIVDTEGNRLGAHQGIAHYTLGQRKGLNLSGGPWHVVALDGTSARVVVAHPAEAMIRRVEVAEATWIRAPAAGEALQAKVRYQMKPAACSLGMESDGYELVFDTPQKPTAPGQVAAVYAGQELLGGGIVLAAHRAGAHRV